MDKRHRVTRFEQSELIEIYDVDCISKRSQVEINPRTAQTYILMDYSNDNVHENMSDGISMVFFLITIKQEKDDERIRLSPFPAKHNGTREQRIFNFAVTFSSSHGSTISLWGELMERQELLERGDSHFH